MKTVLSLKKPTLLLCLFAWNSLASAQHLIPQRHLHLNRDLLEKPQNYDNIPHFLGYGVSAMEGFQGLSPEQSGVILPEIDRLRCVEFRRKIRGIRRQKLVPGKIVKNDRREVEAYVYRQESAFEADLAYDYESDLSGEIDANVTIPIKGLPIKVGLDDTSVEASLLNTSLSASNSANQSHFTVLFRYLGPEYYYENQADPYLRKDILENNQDFPAGTERMLAWYRSCGNEFIAKSQLGAWVKLRVHVTSSDASLQAEVKNDVTAALGLSFGLSSDSSDSSEANGEEATADVAGSLASLLEMLNLNGNLGMDAAESYSGSLNGNQIRIRFEMESYGMSPAFEEMNISEFLDTLSDYDHIFSESSQHFQPVKLTASSYGATVNSYQLGFTEEDLRFDINERVFALASLSGVVEDLSYFWLTAEGMLDHLRFWSETDPEKGLFVGGVTSAEENEALIEEIISQRSQTYEMAAAILRSQRCLLDLREPISPCFLQNVVGLGQRDTRTLIKTLQDLPSYVWKKHLQYSFRDFIEPIENLGWNIISLRSESLPVDCQSLKTSSSDLMFKARSWSFAENRCQWDLFSDFTVLSPWKLRFNWSFHAPHGRILGKKSELPLFSERFENGSAFAARVSLIPEAHGLGLEREVNMRLESVTVMGPVPWGALDHWHDDSWLSVALP